MFLLLMALLSGQERTDLPSDCARAMTTLEVNACVARDLQNETRRMETYLQAAFARMRMDTPKQDAWLRASQPAWEAYADIACGAVYDWWGEGTVRTAEALRCRIDLTRERTHFVWRSFLTYADSTPPILPEPAGPAGEVIRRAPPSSAPPTIP